MKTLREQIFALEKRVHVLETLVAPGHRRKKPGSQQLWVSEASIRGITGYPDATTPEVLVGLAESFFLSLSAVQSGGLPSISFDVQTKGCDYNLMVVKLKR